MKFNKVVIYGWKLHSHTQSYVHYGFFRAFEELGHEVMWIDNTDDISNINFDNCLFLTEGQVDQGIPLNKTSKYILHNCEKEKYEGLSKLNLQIFHNSINDPNHDQSPNYHPTFFSDTHLTKINDYTFVNDNTLYQPWATDLLPREINLNNARNVADNKDCVWVGTYGGADSEYQNHTELDPFFNECKKRGWPVKIINPWKTPISPKENRDIINRAYLAPGIQGQWQVKHEYAPQCRILKNISYGNMGITNNKYTNMLFGEKLVYDRDPIKLFYKSIEKKKDLGLVKEIKLLMREVKENHTFINRANQILAII